MEYSTITLHTALANMFNLRLRIEMNHMQSED